MTDQDILDYYSSLLIKQYAGKPNAVAQVQAFASTLVLGQVFTAVQNAYTLGTAVGVQLDVLGKYIGLSRVGSNFAGPITLNDTDYTLMLRLAAIRNSSNATLYELQNTIQDFFPGSIEVFDYQDMTMSYFVNSDLFSASLAEFALNAGLFPRPAAVGLRTTIVGPSSDINNFFAFRTYGAAASVNTSPLNSYSSYTLTYPWLSYVDGISI